MESFPVGDMTMCQSACLFVGRHFGRFFSLCFSSLSFCQYAVFCRFWPPLSGVAVVLWPLSYLFSAGFRLFSAPVGRRDWGRGGGGGSGSAFRRPFRRVGLVRGWWRAVVVCAARRRRAALVQRASGWRVCREAEPSGTRSRGVRGACCGRGCREAEPSGTHHRHEHHTSITRASHGQPHQIDHRNTLRWFSSAPPSPCLHPYGG